MKVLFGDEDLREEDNYIGIAKLPKIASKNRFYLMRGFEVFGNDEKGYNLYFQADDITAIREGAI